MLISGIQQSIQSLQFSLVQLLSYVRLFATPWTAAHQASLSITNSQSLLKLMSIKLVMPSNHLTLCRPLLLPPSIFPSIRVFSNESVLCIRWPKYWSFSFSISPSNEYSGLISFRIDWLDLKAKVLYIYIELFAMTHKESACNAGDTSLILASGRSPGERNDNPFQYSCLKIPKYRGSWWVIVQRVTKSWKQLNTQTHVYIQILFYYHYKILNIIPCVIH